MDGSCRGGGRGVVGDRAAGQAGGGGLRVSVMAIATAPVVVEEGMVVDTDGTEGTVARERRTGEGDGC